MSSRELGNQQRAEEAILHKTQRNYRSVKARRGVSSFKKEATTMKQSIIRTVGALAGLLYLQTAFAQQAPGQAAPGRGAATARPVSPEIHADRTVTFRLA